jgi:membrane protease YdiL (CAAX protease family)
MWLLRFLTSVDVFFFLGGLGPMGAAFIVSWQLGTTRTWLGRILRWRVSPWFYAFAVLFPVALYAATNVVALLFGEPPDTSLLDGIVPSYLGTWGAVLFLGGLEEPGWRGFALPQLQHRYSPVRATLVLGVMWGLWHLPIQPLAIVMTVPMAFFYTWLFNRTQSALLCIVLHASMTPAQDHVRLVADTPTLELAVVLVMVAAAAGFVAVTRGRLGQAAGTSSRTGS